MAGLGMAHSLSYLHRRTEPLLKQDRLAVQRANEVIREGIEVLQRCPRPDTFLGRKTQEPFPNEIEV